MVPVAATGNHEGREDVGERTAYEEEEIRFFRKGSDTDTRWLRMRKKRESW